MKKRGWAKVRKMIRTLPPSAELTFAEANEENGKELMALAKALIPERTGASRRAIRGAALPEGGYLVDFGQKAKVIEGRKGPRPFVNPALRATKDSRKRRNRKALRDAIKRAAGNG